MYQYKNYMISNNKPGFGFIVWAPDGTVYGPFATDKDAENFIDEKEES